MGSYSQKDRHIAIKVDGFGNDSILLSEIKEGHEAVSSLFNYKLSLLSTQEIEPSAILGKPASIRLTLIDKGERFFNGVISSWRLGGACGPDQELFSYEAELSPRLWLASQCRNYRTFPDSNAKDVALKVLSEWKLDVDSKKLTVESQPVEMIVQYGESDFAFASRLLESLGVFYVFKHDASGKHVMTLFNANPEYVEGQSQNVPFKAHLESRGISSWASGERLGAGSVSVHAYNYRDSGSAFDVKAETNQKEGSGVKDSLSVNFSEQGWTAPSANSHFQDMVKAAAESAASSLRNSQFLWRGETVNRNLLPGEAFKLSGFPKAGSKDRDVLVRETLIKTRAAAYYLDESLPKSEQDKIGKATFTCSLVCSDLAVKFQPSSLTPRPQALCPEHGVVLSGTSSIIQTDKWGRVKVKLNWGRDKEADQSFWCRVLQGRTGNGAGNVSLPEKGQEVVVSFLGGDPEAPVVAGCLYNSSNAHPTGLAGESPRERHRSVMRHPTVAQDGSLTGPANFKELAFSNMESVSAGKKTEADAQSKATSLDSGYSGISSLSDSNIVSVASSNQAIVSGTDGEIDANGCVAKQPKLGSGNIVISAGNSITLQVGKSSIVLTDSSIEIVNQLCKSATGFDASLSLSGGQASLEGMQAELSGTLQASVYSGISMSSYEATLYEVAISGTKVGINAAGIANVVNDIELAVFLLTEGLSTYASAAGDSAAAESVDSDEANMMYAILALGLLSAVCNAPAIFSHNSSSLSMTGEGISSTSKRYNVDSGQIHLQGDATAGEVTSKGVLSDLLGGLLEGVADVAETSLFITPDTMSVKATDLNVVAVAAHNDIGGVHNQQHAANNQQAGANNQQHGANNQQVGAHNQQHGANNAQAGANNQQQGANNVQIGANNLESGMDEELFAFRQETAGLNDEM